MLMQAITFKMMIMMQKEGMKGYGIYWMLLEFLRLQDGYKADLRVLPILAQKMRVTVTTLKRIIYDYALFEVNGTSFSSPGLTLRMKPWDAQQDAKRESGRRGGLANQQKIRDAKASNALATNKENKENETILLYLPRETRGRMRRFFLFHRSMHSTNRHTTMKD